MSGGEQQRVALASIGDSSGSLVNGRAHWERILGRQNAFEAMTTLVDDLGQTIVLVTHDPAIASIAKRLICIRDGEIEQDGTPQSILGSGVSNSVRKRP